MRLFGSICILVAMFYAWTYVAALRSGETYAMRGDTSIVHRRDDPQSNYDRYLTARMIAAIGFLALGGVMHIFAARFDKMNTPAK